MKKISHFTAVITITTIFYACGNKSQQAEPIMYDDLPAVEMCDSDTTLSSVQDDDNRVVEKSSASVNPSSASHTHKSSSNDNMRGFDPASEDDMDDNGMSRYMENNDEEGWD